MYDIEDKCVDYVLKESGESSMSDRAVRLFFLACDDSNSMEKYLVTFLSVSTSKLLSVIWT